MQPSRQQILDILQTQGSATVQDLVRDLELALPTVRHHLSVLEREGLVKSKTVRRKVGRPHLAYSLSPEGQERLPKKYDRLSASLLSGIKDDFGAEALDGLLLRIVDGWVDDRVSHLEEKQPEERTELLVDVLEGEGFTPQLDTSEGRLRIIQHTCPYQAVVYQHPEVCQLDSELICRCLGETAVRTVWRVDGDDTCVFEVDLAASREDENLPLASV